jgi:hypothetical protein
MKFKAWAKAKGFTDSDLEGKMCTGIRAAYQASADYDAEDPEGQEPKDGKDGDAKAKGARQLDVAASATGTDTSATGVADIRAEGARIASIQSRFGTAIQAARGELVKQLTDTQTKAINDGWSDEQAATQIELFTLRASRNPVDHQDGSPFNIQTGGVGANITNDVLASAAALSFGIPEKVALTRRDGTKLSEAEGNAAISGRLKGMGLQQIMGIVASAHGIHVAPGPMSNDTINAVIHAERRLDILGADAGFSTVSLLGITENIMNKAMLVGYGDVPSNVEDICYQTDTNDFKAFKRYRMTSSGRMQPVTSAGELKSFGLQDESYANQVSTQGMILTIRREDVINDDMGALTEAPKALGREAAQCREQAVFTTFLAGLATLFPVDGSKGNYFDGAASPLSVPSITTAVQKFMEQVDANNRPINIVPDRILIPPALAGVANGIYAKDSGLVVTALGSTAAKAVEPNKNIHSGLYRPIVSPYMANRAGKGLAGSSDTQWILLPNPSGGLAVVQIGYLRGQRTPIIERGEAPFTVLGIQMRCIYDFGVALHDYRCGVYSKGTS